MYLYLSDPLDLKFSTYDVEFINIKRADNILLEIIFSYVHTEYMYMVCMYVRCSYMYICTCDK